jgi:hypothetical protein
VVWTFDVNNKTDLFEFQAEIDNLHASYMNQFMEPNLNILLEGELYKTYFTISGTDNTSNIDFKIKYDAFDVNILKDGGKDKKELLSKVVNIFISKDSESSKKTFKEASRHDIARHKTKSVFNFIWISARAGLIKAMIID